MLDFHSATHDSITVNATAPTYTGGTALTGFAYHRNDGPLTAYQPQVTQTASLESPLQVFSGLPTPKVPYTFQIAAINALGQGPWSDSVSFYATSPPPNSAAFTLTSSSTTSISVSWTPPTPGANDCAIEGYQVLIEDIHDPGYQLAYNGSRSSLVTAVTIGYPRIQPSHYYKLLLQTINCGQVPSTGATLTLS
jgi:hypothetical protein